MIGWHVTTEVAGAIAKEALIEKSVEDPGDAHPVGARGRVLGSVGPLEGEFGYCVEWEDTPGVAVFVRGRKVRAAGGGQ